MSFQEQIDLAIREKRLYFIGDRLPHDWYEAFKLWLPVAQAGDAKAQFNIGRCYVRGDGIEKDSARGIDWLLKAAAQDEPRSQFNLYFEYQEKNDPVSAEKWLRSAAKLGESRAMNALATNLLNAGDKDSARYIFKQLFDKGDQRGKLGLIACDIEIFSELSSTASYSSYQASITTSAAGNVSGGGTVTSTHHTPALLLRLKNNSPFAASISANIEIYDFENIEKKHSDSQLKFPKVNPGEVTEITETMYDPKGGTGFRVFLTSYRVWEENEKVYWVFSLPEKKLVYKQSNKEQTKSALIGCFIVIAFFVGAIYLSIALGWKGFYLSLGLLAVFLIWSWRKLVKDKAAHSSKPV